MSGGAFKSLEQTKKQGKSQKKKVVVGMSGGVDSSVAALLLQEQGYEVIGITMQLWERQEGKTGGDYGSNAVKEAKQVAKYLGIPHYVLDFREEFRRNVIDYFVASYLCGETPNPCIACNRHVKWDALLQYSLELGADYIATGHYAGVKRFSNGRYSVKCSVTGKKDQTYALYNLTQEQLKHTLLPVGAYEKPKIREIARRAGIPVADKPDSQDICFVEQGDYAGFIRAYTGKDCIAGEFVDEQGKILGTHKGLIHYTVGQRKGLGLSFGRPVYVRELCPEKNQVVIGEDKQSLRLYAAQVNYMSVGSLEKPRRLFAKIRYNHSGDWCVVTPLEGNRICCTFEKPQRAVTPGQAVVFYEEDYIVGGGTIVREA